MHYLVDILIGGREAVELTAFEHEKKTNKATKTAVYSYAPVQLSLEIMGNARTIGTRNGVATRFDMATPIFLVMHGTAKTSKTVMPSPQTRRTCRMDRGQGRTA